MREVGSRPTKIVLSSFPCLPPPIPLLNKTRPESPKAVPVSPLADEDTFDDFLMFVDSDGYDPSSMGLLEEDDEAAEKCGSRRSSFKSIPDLENCSSRPITPPFINGAKHHELASSVKKLPPLGSNEESTRAVSPSSVHSSSGYSPKYIETARKLAKAMRRCKHSRIQLLRIEKSSSRPSSPSSSKEQVHHMSDKARDIFEASEASRREICLKIRPDAF
jgi:hypothetical protein